MRIRVYIAGSLLLLAAWAPGCRELPDAAARDFVLAQVGRTELYRSEAAAAVPPGMTGSDSAACVRRYAERWVRRQLKLREAERLFSASEADIDRAVEEYRQSLLIRKFDRYCVDRGIDTLFSEEEMAAYYADHRSEFLLDRTLVRGCVVRYDDRNRQSKRLLELMASPSPARQRDFRDLCAKNEFALYDFTERWVDFQEFLGCLPTLRSQSYDEVLGVRGVQQMHDDRDRYAYRVDAVLRPGDPVPLELVRGDIRRILFNRRQSELIRDCEERLYEEAAARGDIRIYEPDKTDNR